MSTPKPLEAFACGSASTTSTVFSSVANDAAKLMVVVVFADTAFLVGQCDYFSHILNFLY